MSVSSSVREAWEANTRVNGVLLAHLTPEMLEAQTPGGGYTVARHLAHIINTVQYWGSLRDKARFEALPSAIREYDEATGHVEIPTIVFEDGTILSDAAAIVEALDERYPETDQTAQLFEPDKPLVKLGPGLARR